MTNKLLPEYFKTKDHEEGAAEHHEHHVEEEVPVVVVAYAVVEPGAVVVHLQDAAVANTAVVGSRWFGLDAFLANRSHLRTMSNNNFKYFALT